QFSADFEEMPIELFEHTFVVFERPLQRGFVRNEFIDTKLTKISVGRTPERCDLCHTSFGTRLDSIPMLLHKCRDDGSSVRTLSRSCRIVHACGCFLRASK